MNKAKKDLLSVSPKSETHTQADVAEAEIRAEYEDRPLKSRKYTGGRGRGRKMLKEEYKRGQADHTPGDEVGKTANIRTRILEMSLFPNLVNKKMIYTNS